MSLKKEIIFPDNTKLYITENDTPNKQEITLDTIKAVKSIIAEFPNSKTISSIPEIN